jgi:hypothetical protein
MKQRRQWPLRISGGGDLVRDGLVLGPLPRPVRRGEVDLEVERLVTRSGDVIRRAVGDEIGVVADPLDGHLVLIEVRLAVGADVLK